MKAIQRRVIILLSAALALGAIAVTLFLRAPAPPPTRRAPDDAAGHTRPGSPTTTDWPIHRGDPGLRGLAADTLPRRPSLLWTFDAGAPVTATAIVVSGRVCVGAGSGKFHALALDTGAELWRFDAGYPIEAPAAGLDGRVYVGSTDGTLFALDLSTGAEAWRFATGDKIAGAANRAVAGGRTLILFGSHDACLYCLDAAGGGLVWKHETDNYINGTPAVDPERGLAVFGGCDASVHIVRIADGHPVRTIDLGAYIASSVALRDGVGYVGHYGNEVTAFSIDSGEILWTYSRRDQPYFSSAAVTDRLVLIGGRDRHLHAIDRATGKAAWQFATRDEVDSSPVACDGRVWFGSNDGRLYALDADTGAESWSYEIGSPLTASPAVASGKIIIGADDGRLYAFGP